VIIKDHGKDEKTSKSKIPLLAESFPSSRERRVALMPKFNVKVISISIFEGGQTKKNHSKGECFRAESTA